MKKLHFWLINYISCPDIWLWFASKIECQKISVFQSCFTGILKCIKIIKCNAPPNSDFSNRLNCCNRISYECFCFIKRSENQITFPAAVSELSATITKELHVHMHVALNFN